MEGSVGAVATMLSGKPLTHSPTGNKNTCSADADVPSVLVILQCSPLNPAAQHLPTSWVCLTVLVTSTRLKAAMDML